MIPINLRNEILSLVVKVDHREWAKVLMNWLNFSQ